MLFRSVVFDQPQQALVCARAMVQATRAANLPGRAPEDRIEVCIGLGYGTVLRIDDDEVWGAEVNAASKLGEEIMLRTRKSPHVKGRALIRESGIKIVHNPNLSSRIAPVGPTAFRVGVFDLLSPARALSIGSCA